MGERIEIESCFVDSDFHLAKQITKEYIEWLNMDLSFQNIDEEFDNFTSIYSLKNNGIFLLARHNGELAGGVGFRKFEENIAEMKRLFVYQKFRGMKIGEKLTTQLITEAKRLGYDKMRLDTLGYMKSAIKLYKKLGFEEIVSYRFNPDPTAVYMELQLDK